MEKLSLIFFWLNSIAAALFYSAFRSLELYDYIYKAHCGENIKNVWYP